LKAAAAKYAAQNSDANLDNSLNWRDWLAEYFPRAADAPMPDGGRHANLWEWGESLTPGVRPKPRVEVWPRESGKSTTCQLIAARIATTQVEHRGKQRPRRHFLLYVSGAQKQANVHVQSIAGKLEQMGVGRSLNAYGLPRGWSASLLRTETDFNVLALGLDAASRGLKLDDFRPDWIIFDDIDEREDKPEVTEKKIRTISQSVIPAGSQDCAVLVVQNRILENGVVGQLVDWKADCLLDREPARIEPAVYNLEYEVVSRDDGGATLKITGGVPSWPGQPIEVCEKNLNSWGRVSYLREAQHETDEIEGGLWESSWIEDNRIARRDLPVLERVAIGIDPSGGTGQWGIVAKGRAGHGERAHYYTIEDATPEVGTSTGVSADEAIDCYVRNEADCFAVETNFGGDMAETILRRAAKDKGVPIRVVTVVASRGKQLRAEPVSELAEKGYEHHVGVWPELEKEKKSWNPSDKKSPNRLDADVWATTELMKPKRGGVRQTKTLE
jgi:hypothetical protein